MLAMSDINAVKQRESLVRQQTNKPQRKQAQHTSNHERLTSTCAKPQTEHRLPLLQKCHGSDSHLVFCGLSIASSKSLSSDRCCSRVLLAVCANNDFSSDNVLSNLLDCAIIAD